MLRKHMENNMKSHKLKKRILELIKKSKVVTTTEVSEKLSISWNTAEKYLLELALDNHIQRMKKSGVNLWAAK